MHLEKVLLHVVLLLMLTCAAAPFEISHQNPMAQTLQTTVTLSRGAEYSEEEDMQLPLVGLGTVRLKGGPNTILKFFSLGGRLVDTAQTYRLGRSIKAVGEASKRWPKRSEIFLVSKIPVDAMGYNATRRVIKETLAALQSDYVDMILVHRPWSRDVPTGADDPVTRAQRLGTWDALVEAQKARRVRFIGVANYGTVYLNELAESGRPQPVVNELEFHPWINARQRELVADCQARGIHVIAYNSLGGANAGAESEALPQLSTIAARHGKTVSQVLLRFALEHNITVIPSSNSMTHMKENLGVMDFHVTAQERMEISHEPRPASWGSFVFNDPHRINQGSLTCDTVASLTTRHSAALASMRQGVPWRTTRADDPREVAKAASVKDGDDGKAALKVRTFILDVHGWPVAGLCDSGAALGSLGRDIQRSKLPFVILPRYLAQRYGPLVNETRNELIQTHRRTYKGSSHSPEPKRHRSTPDFHDNCHNVSDGTVPGGGDMRCSLCARWSPLCKVLMRDDGLRAIGQAYYDRVYAARKLRAPAVKPAMVMANAFEGNGANSGGNWHQDVKCKLSDFGQAEVCEEQMKCLAYLDDTFEYNGPFTMLVDYDREELAKRSKLSMLIHGNPFDDDRPFRFDTSDIAHVTNTNGPNGKTAFAIEIHAPAGTVICFDSGNIHHGKNLQRGQRTALTLYLSSPRRSPITGKSRDWLEEAKGHLASSSPSSTEKSL